jgi:putative ABC transport system ATP-binding protein
LIRLHEVRKAYLDGSCPNEILRGVSLHIQQGELVALMGTSGSGKSTLLNMIGALDQDYQGEIFVAEQSLKALKDKALSRFRNATVSFVFQQFHLLPHLPVADNVAMPRWFSGPQSEGNVSRRVSALLERVGLTHKANASPNHLSGGEKQRVAIARALFNHPKILLADEPTGSLDDTSTQEIMGLFRELNERDGVTVLVVTHDREIASQCNRLVSIRQGCLVELAGQQSTSEALSQESNP